MKYFNFNTLVCFTFLVMATVLYNETCKNCYDTGVSECRSGMIDLSPGTCTVSDDGFITVDADTDFILSGIGVTYIVDGVDWGFGFCDGGTE